jgi:hypothetical protein
MVILGEIVKFENNLAEVSDEKGAEIVQAFKGIFVEEGNLPKVENKKKVLTVDDLKKQVQELEAEVKELKSVKTMNSVSEEDLKVVMDIFGSNIDDLKSTCKNFDFPEIEWEGKNKKELALYVATKTLSVSEK